jgi:two-component system, sensor histidine kinase and response regulator
MKKIHAAAETLERALREGDTAAARKLGELSALLGPQVDAIRGALGSPVPAGVGAPVAFDAGAARVAIGRLRGLLAASDGDAAGAFPGLAGALAGAVGQPRLDALEKAIGEYDFEGALSKLDAIARDCGASEEPS